ncbi:MAG TPA: HlyD family efflux transporter periplasmic adaptor subunit [Pirellulales bacterium]|jgi:multidrug efflux pump subunit AcrA (membrane-fusion protein)
MLRLSFVACGIVLAVTLIGVAQQSTGGSPSEAHIRYPECLVKLNDRFDVQVSAQEAGVLQSLEAHEGMEVQAGDVLGQIDDSQAQSKKKVAVAEHKVAQTEAENDVDIRFNQAQSGVAEMEYKLSEEANRIATKARPRVEMEKLRLQWKKAYLAIEQAELKQKTNRLTAGAKEAEVDAADNDIQRRKITAPLAGDVIEITPGVGEWLNPGSPIVRIVQMDKLRVEGMLNIKDFGPDQISNRPVKVMTQVGPSRVEEFQGKVVFIDPELLPNGKYRVLAEVVNRRAEGDGPWLLRPGMQPEEMVIDALPGKPSGTAAQSR